jgi:hypothetical protein
MKKIMFNDRYGLTDAVIEGRKIMTRRLIDLMLKDCATVHKNCWGADWSDEPMSLVVDRDTGGIYCKYCGNGVRLHDGGYHYKTKYKVGEVVAVAQSYFATYAESKWENGIWYNEFADGSDITNHAGWINKMFVKAKYMPHQIRITGIRYERLQDISDEECMREGILESWYESTDTTTYGYADEKKGTAVEFDTPREAFAALIDKVSGRGTWASNPWVVVYEFELVK